MTAVVAAVDVGGTRMKAALVDRDGHEVVTLTRPTPAALDVPGALVQAVAGTVAALRAAAADPGDGAGAGLAGRDPLEVVAAGVVVPGIVDDVRGVAVWASNLGWRDLPVTAPLSDLLGMPVALGHDVRAGLRAEVAWGAAAGSRNVLFIPLGTGIAGALMLDGHVVAADGWAGEIGHVVVEPDGVPCPCGQRGCLETVASASAVARAYAARTAGRGGAPIDAEAVAGLVRAGDADAVAVWDHAVAALARSLVMMTTATGVDHVLVGGGLAQSGETLLAPLRKAVHASLTFQREPRIERARLGERAGCLGAACLAWDVA
ncbi:ROK family protein [Pedococcus sp. NPDC057267]|uniref:ROK family protein n=1 Tax=Pedococcus sp. NPDC057267 TaxID=3346077 RepID=UPI00362B2FEA